MNTKQKTQRWNMEIAPSVLTGKLKLQSSVLRLLCCCVTGRSHPPVDYFVSAVSSSDNINMFPFFLFSSLSKVVVVVVQQRMIPVVGILYVLLFLVPTPVRPFSILTTSTYSSNNNGRHRSSTCFSSSSSSSTFSSNSIYSDDDGKNDIQQEINSTTYQSTSSCGVETMRMMMTNKHHDHDHKSLLSSTMTDYRRNDDYDTDAATGSSSSSQQFSSTPHPLERLSMSPLLLESTQPILSKDECSILLNWCTNIEKEGMTLSEAVVAATTTSTAETFDSSVTSIKNEDDDDTVEKEGLKTLQKLQQRIHHQLLGLTQDQQDYVIPRFISYTPPTASTAQQQQEQHTVESLLPDGLHLDTNNNKHFRHWTILVYLNTCETSGATTFPLAVPIEPRKRRSTNDHDMADDTTLKNAAAAAAIEAAEEMIYDENIQHTRISDDEYIIQLGRTIEQVAVQLYDWEEQNNVNSSHNNTTHDHDDDDGNTSEAAPAIGIRIKPKTGNLCIFSGLHHDGYPHPNSFHGGEVLSHHLTKNNIHHDDDNDDDDDDDNADDAIEMKMKPSTAAVVPGKAVLTFFYEIPMTSFSNRIEFARQVQSREEQFLHFHGFL